MITSSSSLSSKGNKSSTRVAGSPGSRRATGSSKTIWLYDYDSMIWLYDYLSSSSSLSRGSKSPTRVAGPPGCRLATGSSKTIWLWFYDYMISYHHHHYDQEEAKAQPELLVPQAVGVPQDPQSCKPETRSLLWRSSRNRGFYDLDDWLSSLPSRGSKSSTRVAGPPGSRRATGSSKLQTRNIPKWHHHWDQHWRRRIMGIIRIVMTKMRIKGQLICFCTIWTYDPITTWSFLSIVMRCLKKSFWAD